MESISNDTELNELVKMYAEKKNISELAAYQALKQKWIPRSQVFDLVDQNHNTQETTPMTSDLLVEKTRAATEKARLEYEQKRLELLDKSEVREQRRLEMQEAKIQSDEKIALARLEFDKSIAASRLDQDHKQLVLKEELESKRLALKEELESKRLALKEDFDNKLLLIQANKTNSGDVLEQINIVKKIEKTFNDQMILRLEGLGIDTKDLRKAVGEKDGVSLLELLNRIVPIVEKLTQTAPPLTPQQVAEQQLRETETRKQIDMEAKEKAIQFEESNHALEIEKKYLERETQLRQQQEEYYRQREVLLLRASELGLQIDESMNNEQIFMDIEKHESQREKERQEQQRIKDLEQRERQRIEDIEQAGKSREILVARAIELKLPYDDDIPDEDLQAQILRKERGLMMKPKPAVQPEQPATPPEKRKQKAKKTSKQLKKFSIFDMEDVFIQEIEAKSHRSAGLLVAKELKGTPDAPVRIKILFEEVEQIFDTWLNERRGKKGIVYQPIAKEIKEKLPEILEAQNE